MIINIINLFEINTLIILIYNNLIMVINKKRRIEDIQIDDNDDDVKLLMYFVRETWFLHTDYFLKKEYRIRPKKRRYNTRYSRK